MVSSCGINAVLIGHDFPKLGSDLVAALASLDVNNFSHGIKLCLLGLYNCDIVVFFCYIGSILAMPINDVNFQILLFELNFIEHSVLNCEGRRRIPFKQS